MLSQTSVPKPNHIYIYILNETTVSHGLNMLVRFLFEAQSHKDEVQLLRKKKKSQSSAASKGSNFVSYHSIPMQPLKKLKYKRIQIIIKKKIIEYQTNKIISHSPPQKKNIISILAKLLVLLHLRQGQIKHTSDYQSRASHSIGVSIFKR